MVSKTVIQETANRYATRTPERKETIEKLRTGSPVQADSPERVNKRITHLTTSEMARATALPAERLAPPTSVNVLERIIGRNDLVSVTFLDLAVRVARTVARVRIRNAAGQLAGYGTGFLIAPRVLITNNHVLGSAAEAAASQVEFNYQDTADGLAPASVTFGFDPNSLFFTNQTLDYTVVAVRDSTQAEVAAFGFNKLVEEEGKVLLGESLNIIQHPNGEPKQLALRENILIDILSQFLHYQTDTAPGSSGSPVFNDQWEVVALHHSGVPRTDAQGRYLTKDGGLWTPAMGEHRIDWIANEGARVSQIVASLKAASGLSAAARALRDSILSPQSPIEALSNSSQAPRDSSSSVYDPRSPVISADGLATWTLPVQISVRIGGHAVAVPTDTGVTPPALDVTADAAVAAAGLLLEKMVSPTIDVAYGKRKGYKEDFLGTAVPLPRVTKPSLVSKMEDDEFVIPYQHFSVVVNKKRRLALFTASNVDGRKRAKQPEEGRDYSRKGLTGLGPNDIEKWVTDPRIPEAHQLPDTFFTKDRQSFDKGHIVRREDVAWGRSYAMVRRGNNDTYHTTNCSPQVKGFNQSGDGGIWGALENFILKQAKTETYCLFAGPVFDDDDEVFEGVDDRGAVEVQIPSKYWKVVVADSAAGIQSFAFVLEQDLTSVVFREEFAVNAQWAEHMVSIASLEQLLDGIEFPQVVKDADQFGSPVVDEIARQHLESLGVRTPTASAR
jgi:endonuclease G